MSDRTRMKPAAAALITGVVALLVPAAAWAGGGDVTFDADMSLFAMYATAFGVGFATSLTPCVYPMIPIVVGVFGARDEMVSRKKAFALASCYVLGMGVMFSSLGVVFSLLGKSMGSILADPWFVLPLVGFYVVLAVSMFGAFEIALPMSWQNRLNQVGGRGYKGAFGMGVVGGLTAAPCTGPFLAGILFWLTAKGTNVAVGASVLFTYAIGMGVLFLAIGAFALSVPKSGRWMEWVKSFGGIALLGVAVYFLRPIWPALRQAVDPSTMFYLASIGAILVGLAIGAIHLSFHGASRSLWLRKAGGIALTVVGITGAVNWHLTPPSKLPWMHDEAAAFAAAKRDTKGVMIDISAEWCIPCKKLDADTFSAFEVREVVLDGFVPLKIDVSDDSDEDEAIKEKYNAENLPAVIFLDTDGKEIGRINEFLPPDEFLAALERIRSPAQARAAP